MGGPVTMEEECSWYQLGCKAEQWVESRIGDAIENMANAVLEAFGKAVTSLGTLWVHIGTPNLTGTGGSSSITAGDAPSAAGNITTVLGYVMWIALVIAAISIIILGMIVAAKVRRGEGVAAVGRLGLILGGVILISGAGALVAGLLPGGPTGAGGTVFFLQSAVWWLVGGLVVLSLIIGGAKMAWEQRAEPGKETLKSMLTLIVVSAMGVTVVGLLVSASDAFSVWVINASLACDVVADGSCFGSNMLTLLALTTGPATGALGALLIIILGLIAILAAAFQIVLMVARSAMLVILSGILPLSASATNTEMGSSWFKKNIGWLVAFILYKPAAAIVYAAAFHLLGTNIFSDDGTGFVAVLTGLMLMVIALFALPALMRFVTPLVGSMAGGAGGALGIAAVAALPTGAAALGRLGTGGGSNTFTSGSAPDSGASTGSPSGSSNGSAGSVGASGSSGSAGGTGSGSSGSGGAMGVAGPTGPGGSDGATGAGSVGAPGSAGSGTGAGAAAASAGGASSAGAGAASGATAGAAGGPVGMAAGAAASAVAGGARKVTETAQEVGEQSTEGGPSGSR